MTARLAFFATLLLGGFGLTAASARAADRPFGEIRGGYWSSTRNLDDEEHIAKATALLNWRPRIGEGARVGLNARLGWADAAEAERAEGRLREAHLDLKSGAWSGRLGRQIIAWGRADRVNPTDNLSPRDFTLLVPEDDEQRLGIDAASVQHALSKTLSLQGVVARFTPHRTPTGLLPSNLIHPTKPESADWALKLDRTGGAVDWSVSYYQGHDRFTRYVATQPAPGALVFAGGYEKQKTLGVDFATALGAWTMRGELGHTQFTRLAAAPRSDDARRYVTRATLGADRDFRAAANINLQVFALTRSAYQDPRTQPRGAQPIARALDRLNSEFADKEWGATVRVSDRFLNERLKGELGALWDFTHESWVLRPRLSYSLSDAFKLVAGADYLHGEAQSFFGSREKNRTAFLEVHFIY